MPDERKQVAEAILWRLQEIEDKLDTNAKQLDAMKARLDFLLSRQMGITVDEKDTQPG